MVGNELSEDQARALAEDFLARTQSFQCALLPDATETIGFWFFRWNAREAVESRGRSGYLKELGPLAVERSTGAVSLLPFERGGGYPPVPPITWPVDANPATRRGAIKRVQLYLDATNTEPVVTIPEEVMERAYGWVVPFNSRAFVETGNDMDILVGSGPVVVLRATGELHVLPSSPTVEPALAALEERLGLNG